MQGNTKISNDVFDMHDESSSCFETATTALQNGRTMHHSVSQPRASSARAEFARQGQRVSSLEMLEILQADAHNRMDPLAEHSRIEKWDRDGKPCKCCIVCMGQVRLTSEADLSVKTWQNIEAAASSKIRKSLCGSDASCVYTCS